MWSTKWKECDRVQPAGVSGHLPSTKCCHMTITHDNNSIEFTQLNRAVNDDGLSPRGRASSIGSYKLERVGSMSLLDSSRTSTVRWFHFSERISVTLNMKSAECKQWKQPDHAVANQSQWCQADQPRSQISSFEQTLSRHISLLSGKLHRWYLFQKKKILFFN